MNLEPKHNEAMRKEIGYRLRVLLSREQETAPQRLVQQVRQLGKVDHDPVGEITFDPKARIERIDTWLRALFVQEQQQLRERLQHEPNRHERDALELLLSKIDDTLGRELGTRESRVSGASRV